MDNLRKQALAKLLSIEVDEIEIMPNEALVECKKGGYMVLTDGEAGKAFYRRAECIAEEMETKN